MNKPISIEMSNRCGPKRAKMVRSKHVEELAANKSPVKSPEKQPAPPQKHSAPFYISRSLFDNKRLKQFRCRWAEVREAAIRRKKTERRKERLMGLKPDLTIDLLSDDEEPERQESHNETKLPSQPQSQPPQQFVAFPANVQLSQLPYMTLIPVQLLTTAPPTAPVQPTAPTPISTSTPKSNKDKRKVRSKRMPRSPVCSESIVLTDDDSDDGDTRPPPPPPQPPVEKQSTQPPLPSKFSAQVDEDVSVSLVPRSTAGGTCSSRTNKSDLFPMLPDETTVHTVIANRIYELSLSKLREGLATCGVAEFADEQEKIASTSRRKGNYAPPEASPPPGPISLKLSSDLSISLISDDEQDVDEQQSNSKGVVAQPQHPDSLLVVQQPPPLPLITGVRSIRQKPRKRKLG